MSPDGKTIVFDLLGDLYTLPASGGEARPIVTGPDFAAQPSWAPDGRTIAFVSDRDGSDNVWLAGADGGNPRRLTNRPRAAMLSPAWSADGRRVLVTVQELSGPRVAELWEFDAATGAGARLVENANGAPSLLISAPAPGPYGAHASADGRFVYFTSVTPRAYGVRAGASSRVARLDRRTGRAEPLALGGTNPMRPRLSPDGALLAYAAQEGGVTGLRVRRLADGRAWWVRRSIDGDELEARASRDVVPGYAFTPDGRAIVIAADGGIHRVSVSGNADTVVPFRARVRLDVRAPLHTPQRLAAGPVRARFVQQPAFAADGRVALSAFARIYVTDASGRAPRRLTQAVRAREFEPAWSPDGAWVAFVTWTSDGGALWKARVDGTAPLVRLTTDSAFYSQPAWSPDGARLVALRAPEVSARAQPFPVPSDAELVAVPAGGGAWSTVAPAGPLRRPHFAREADRVYASSAATGLVSMHLDGTDRRTHGTLAARGTGGAPGGPGRAATALLSPDGRAVAVQLGDSLVRMPLGAAGDSLRLDASTPGAALLATDAPEWFAWSGDGSSVRWVTGRVLHTAPNGGPADSAEVVVETARAVPEGSVVLRNARAITMRGDEIIPRADVVVTGGRIAAIGRAGTVTVPRGARVLDLAGRTVIPGIVDVHAHWGVRTGILQPDATSPLANLAYGVTTVRDPQAPPDVFVYADLAEAGEMPSPRVYSTGPGLFADLDFRSLDDARRTVRRYRDRYGTHLLKSYLVGNRRQRQWVVQAASEFGMMPTTEGGADAKTDLTHALDGFSGNEHALPDTPLRRDVVQLLAASGITYTPTLLVAFGGPLPIYGVMARENPYANAKLRRFFPAEELYQRSATRLLWFRPEDERVTSQARDVAAVVRAGGRVALGGHGEMQGLQVHWEMRLLASGGLRPHEVLRIATRNGAEALGLDAELGSLEVGKAADLVVLDRDPLADIHNTTAIRYVMKNGFLYDGATLDGVWPRREPLPAPWWQRASVRR